ncbi:MAG TPA: ATP-binding protein, partial [Acidobacteriota bacterium]|nr:ATP-binding protein [Acidobacteriota bacterium]
YALHRAIEKQKVGRIELKLDGPGMAQYFEVTLTPLYEKETIFSGTLLIFWDSTERRLSEEKLRHQAEELAALNQMKDRLFSIISHDLRSPLATLMSILGASKDTGLTAEEFQSYLPMIRQNIGYTTNLLDNLLNWTRSQLKGEMIQSGNFMLCPVVIKNLQLIEKRAHEKGITTGTLVADDVAVHADPDMIDLVIRNLLSNAVKYCSEGQSITVTCRQEGEQVIVCVADTGVGMSEETQSQLFGLGTLSKPGTKYEKGTGLGLKLCKDFVEKNGGKIWVNSEPGKGSQFYFSLPAAV